MPRLTDEEREAMEWLRQMTPGYDCMASRAAATLKAMLAQPRMPEKITLRQATVLLEAYRASHLDTDYAMKNAYTALYAELSKPPEPETKEVDVWHVEYAGFVDRGVSSGWEPMVTIHTTQAAAETTAVARGERPSHYRHIAVTGPHKQRIPV